MDKPAPIESASYGLHTRGTIAQDGQPAYRHLRATTDARSNEADVDEGARHIARLHRQRVSVPLDGD
jgi:hypothetical protein